MAEPLVFDARDPQAEPGLSRWLALQRSLALSPQAAVEALRACADPRGVLASVGGSAPTDAAALPEAVRRLARSGALLVPYGSPAYPWRLSHISDPAPVLTVVGDLESLSAPAVAIVGSRAATAYGRGVARQLAGELAAAGLVIVSGLAHGIDAEAHRAALEAGGRTIAVQACGPDHVYPAAHRELAARIVRQGAIVTELPPGARPRPAYFPLRNRLISGLSLGLLVIEARERSGSLTTVRHALTQGREVFSVPGPITAPSSAGTNRLLREGACPALSARDVLEGLGLPMAVATPATPESAASQDPPAVRAVIEALERGAATRDELSRALPSVDGLAHALLELELAGRVARDRHGRFRVLA